MSRLIRALAFLMDRKVEMPLPNFTEEGGFHIDLDLLDIGGIAQVLEIGTEQVWMANKFGNDRVAQMQPHGSS